MAITNRASRFVNRVSCGGIVMVSAALASAALAELATRVDEPADIASSAYLFRADRKPEENPPEAWFLFSALKHPQAGVLCGLLWEEPRPVDRVELCWPPDATRIPRPEDIAVRWLPHGDSSSWWSRRAAAGGKLEIATADTCQVSADRRTYVYRVDALRPERATDNLIVAARDPAAQPSWPVPTVRAFTPEPWKLVRLEIEWGFQPGTEHAAVDGQLEVYNGILGTAQPLAGDRGTTLTGDGAWQSKPAAEPEKTGTAPAGPQLRRGIAVQVLYLGTSWNTTIWPQHARVEDANRTIVTVRTHAGSFSFLPADLESGPILAPEHGFFVRALERRPAKSPRPQVTAVPGTLLTEKVDALAGSPAVRAWGSNATPWFGANAAEQLVTVSTFALPPRCVAMHPAPDRPVAVAWRSPLQCKIRIEARIADADAHSGNGIEWSLTHDSRTVPRTLAQGAIDNGGTQSIPGTGAAALPDLAVEPGDFVSLIVGAKANDHACDTTVVELKLTEVGGQARSWSLTQDVAGSVHAGNPHDGAAGTPGVWHFYSPDRAPRPVVFPSTAATARHFVAELAVRNLKTIRQRVREHSEQTWDGAMRALHTQGDFPPYPQPEFEPPAQVDLPDGRLTEAWRCGAWHLLRVLKKDSRGRYIMRDYPYDALAHESFLIIRALDLQGQHAAARDGLARWLERDERQPIRLDGLFSDASGALSGVEWDWQHAGGPGLMHWQLVEHALLTGDQEWFARAEPKLRANADWLLRQRQAYPADVPGRERLWTHGLLPPHNTWDSTNWRPWYETNANYWFGLRRYAERLAQFDPPAGEKYLAAAEAYAQDILAAVERSLVLSPVIRVRDGTYRSFLPPTPYMRGPASRSIPTSFGSPEHTPGLYPDVIRGGVHLLNLSGLLPATDRRAQGILDVLEDRLLLEHHRLPMRTPGYEPDRDWFSHAGWYYQCGIERTADVHLRWDDVPNFLRTFYNQYAVDIVVGPYTFNEHTTRGPPDKSFEEAAFLERLRNMLVMEEGDTLWLARGTPRAWLQPGQRIAVKQMPSHFGPLDYEIVSDTAHGKITALLPWPARKTPQEILLRLRHPQAAPLHTVTVNGQDWRDFDATRETIRLHGLRGDVRVEASYETANRTDTGGRPSRSGPR